MTLLTLRRREPQVARHELPNEYTDFMNSFLRAKQRYEHDCTSVPAVNIFEEPAQFVIEVAAPGYSKKDFNVSIDKDTLTIGAEVKVDEKEVKYNRCEFSKGSFQRNFTIGKSVDTSKIDASYTDGILRIILKKREEAQEKPARSIIID